MAWIISRNGNYYIGWREGTRDRYESAHTRDAKEAETQRLAKALSERINEGPVSEPSPEMTFVALCELYKKQADVVDKTMRMKQDSWDHWTRIVGVKAIGAITAEDVKLFKSTLILEKYAVASISIYLRDLMTLTKFATKKGLIKLDPCSHIKLPDQEDVYRFLTVEEEAALMDVANPLMRRIIPFALETGLRLSQIVDLNWKQFDHKDHLVKIPGQKRQKQRHIPVFDRALAAMGQPKMTGKVFDDAISDDQIKKMWKRTKKAAHIKGRLRFHDLRHTCASRLAEVLTAVELRDFFGWSSVAMADRYMHSTTKSIKEKIQRAQTTQAALVSVSAPHPK